MTLDQVLAELDLLKDHVNSSGHAAVEHVKASVRELMRDLTVKPEVSTQPATGAESAQTLAQQEIPHSYPESVPAVSKKEPETLAPESEPPAFVGKPEPPKWFKEGEKRGKRGPYKKHKK